MHKAACSPNLGVNMGPGKGGCTGSKEGARVHGSLAMNHERRQLRATVIVREEPNKDSIRVDACYRLSGQDEGEDEDSFKQPEVTS